MSWGNLRSLFTDVGDIQGSSALGLQLQLTTPHGRAWVPYSVWPARPPAEHPAARRLAAPHALVAARRPASRSRLALALARSRAGSCVPSSPPGSRPPRRACRPTHNASGAADAAMAARARLLCCGRTRTPPRRRGAPPLAARC